MLNKDFRDVGLGLDELFIGLNYGKVSKKVES